MASRPEFPSVTGCQAMRSSGILAQAACSTDPAQRRRLARNVFKLTSDMALFLPLDIDLVRTRSQDRARQVTARFGGDAAGVSHDGEQPPYGRSCCCTDNPA